jgi:hypothetical protein
MPLVSSHLILWVDLCRFTILPSIHLTLFVRNMETGTSEDAESPVCVHLT